MKRDAQVKNSSPSRQVPIASTIPSLTLAPHLEEAYVHANVVMLEHLQKRDLDGAVADAHHILSLYTGQEEVPLPSCTAVSSISSSSPPLAVLNEDDVAKTAQLNAIHDRLGVIQQLPSGVPAKDVLLLHVQQRASEWSESVHRTKTRDVEDEGEEEETIGVNDDMSANDGSSDNTDEEADDAPETSASSTSSASSSSSVAHDERQVTALARQPIQDALAHVVMRFQEKAAASQKRTAPPKQAEDTTASFPAVTATALSTRSLHGTEDQDAELDAEADAWVAAAEADITKEMNRLAIARKHR